MKKNKNRPYLIKPCSNERERFIQREYYDKGWVVLKNGWPDLFCYNPSTKEIEMVEVKSKSQLKIRKKGGKKLGLNQDQLRMHQYLKKVGFVVKIVHVD